jgi:hypothetical protein
LIFKNDFQCKENSEYHIPFGNITKDHYRAEAKFSENTDFELATIVLTGEKRRVRIRFPFSHCYQIIDRNLALVLWDIPANLSKDVEYPLYRIGNSFLIEQIVHRAGGVLAKEELEHYRILTKNLLIDIILYEGQSREIQIEEVVKNEVGQD